VSDPTTIAWDDVLADARTGDLMLFHGGEFESVVIEELSGGKYSHVAMIIQPDPNAPPLLWEENGVPLADDPGYPTEVGTRHKGMKHTGAQLGDLTEVTKVILGYDESAYYRRLQFDRLPDFEAAVQASVTAAEGRPFPDLLEMAASWLGAHLLGAAAPSEAMFCSQLVAWTLQSCGILSPHHVPNYYSPSSFSAESAEPLDLLNGASYEPEIAVEPPR
jgi:hypothetical protein